jgi:hypothetical protein
MAWLGTIVAAALATIVVNVMSNDPNIRDVEVRTFLVKHYQKAFSADPKIEKSAWEYDLTLNYQGYWKGGFSQFHQRYHETLSGVKVVKVLPDTAASNQFPVTLDATDRRTGRTTRRNFIMTLQCTDQTARLPLRTCPADAIHIHVVESVPLRTE